MNKTRQPSGGAKYTTKDRQSGHNKHVMKKQKRQLVFGVKSNRQRSGVRSTGWVGGCGFPGRGWVGRWAGSVCVMSHLLWTPLFSSRVGTADAPTGVTQEEVNTGVFSSNSPLIPACSTENAATNCCTIYGIITHNGCTYTATKPRGHALCEFREGNPGSAARGW